MGEKIIRKDGVEKNERTQMDILLRKEPKGRDRGQRGKIRKGSKEKRGVGKENPALL